MCVTCFPVSITTMINITDGYQVCTVSTKDEAEMLIELLCKVLPVGELEYLKQIIIHLKYKNTTRFIVLSTHLYICNRNDPVYNHDNIS